MTRVTHWTYGSGSAGCMYDSQGTAETKEQAIESALFIFQDLPDVHLASARVALRTMHIYYFPNQIRGNAGADYVEIDEHAGPCPEDD